MLLRLVDIEGADLGAVHSDAIPRVGEMLVFPHPQNGTSNRVYLVQAVSYVVPIDRDMNMTAGGVVLTCKLATMLKPNFKLVIR